MSVLVTMLLVSATCQPVTGGTSEARHAQIVRAFLSHVSGGDAEAAAGLVTPQANFVDTVEEDTVSVEAMLDLMQESPPQARLVYLDRVGTANTIAVKSRIEDDSGSDDQIMVFNMAGGCITGIYQF